MEERSGGAAPRITFATEPIEALEALEAEWRALEKVGEASFFLSWTWLGTLLETVPAAARPALLRGIADGRTVALCVLGRTVERRRRVITSRRAVLNEIGDRNFDCITIEHNGLLTASGVSKTAVWAALVEWFKQGAEKLDELALPGLAYQLPAELVEARGLLRNEIPSPSFHIDLRQLASSEGDIATALSANARSQLRRAIRRLEPLRFERADNLAAALETFSLLKALHIASWERRGIAHAFTRPFFERFHRRLIERNFAAGEVELLRLSSGDRPIGALYNFLRGGRVYAYQSGFDDRDRHERPGAVSHALAIRAAWKAGNHTYDFMAGHNRLKASFATHASRMFWTVLQQPRIAFRLEHTARRVKRALGI